MMWVSITGDVTGTATTTCPNCGYAWGNNHCSAVTAHVYRPNYFSEESDEPEPHRALIVDNWRSLRDAPSLMPPLKWCRLRPEVRAPPNVSSPRRPRVRSRRRSVHR